MIKILYYDRSTVYYIYMYSIILYLYPPFIKTNHDQTIGHPNKLPPQPRYWIRRYSPLLESGEDFHRFSLSPIRWRNHLQAFGCCQWENQRVFGGAAIFQGHLHMDPAHRLEKMVSGTGRGTAMDEKWTFLWWFGQWQVRLLRWFFASQYPSISKIWTFPDWTSVESSHHFTHQLYFHQSMPEYLLSRSWIIEYQTIPVQTPSILFQELLGHFQLFCKVYGDSHIHYETPATVECCRITMVHSTHGPSSAHAR